MKFFLFLSITLLFFSCKSSKKQDIVDFNELTPDSKRNYENDSLKDKNQEQTDFYDSLSSFSKEFIDFMKFEKTNVFKLDTLFFPDRFGAKKTEKWYLKTQNDSLVYIHWEFKDSIKTFNTFYNWLDCYGLNCKSIHIGDKLIFFKRSTAFLIQDQHLFFLESNVRVNIEKILLFFDSKRWKKDWKFVVNQSGRRKVEWYFRNKEAKLIEIKQFAIEN